jgi:hypothetical protein
MLRRNPAPLRGAGRMGMQGTPLITRQRRQRQVEHLCQTPPLVAELIDELGRTHGLADDINRQPARDAELDRGPLLFLGGDCFPASPIRFIAGGQ